MTRDRNGMVSGFKSQITGSKKEGMGREGTLEDPFDIFHDCRCQSGSAIEVMNGATFDLAPHSIFPRRDFHCLDLHDVSSMPDRHPGGDVVTGYTTRFPAPPICRKNALASEVNRKPGLAVVYSFELCHKCPSVGIPNLHLTVPVGFGENGTIACKLHRHLPLFYGYRILGVSWTIGK